MKESKEKLEKMGYRVKISEKAPKFLYSALKEGENMLFARRDRSEWKVIMDLDFFMENFIKEKDVVNYLLCPNCGEKIYEKTRTEKKK